MEVFLGYVLGLGTLFAFARRGDAKEGDRPASPARKAVAWTARQVGSISGKVSSSLTDASNLLREEYARGREEQLAQLDEEAGESNTHDPHALRAATGEKVVHRASAGHLNGN